ncbi:hypothetical protein [Porphyrobacter sp. YT40]|uniref:hypothetical protein n=1 Tax=Porphyrobacter sp. YT40 TaxID=2547601 RepID=UPI001144E23B|nr:hypothetical protein [Porphyrobacter sp. YT40]QDH34414.1 hypothetical protein E2E27_08835 [Porphyrobacter sp. YT40]
MADNLNPQPPRNKWLWPAVIALMGVLAVVVIINPAGDTDGTVEDPIVIEDTGVGNVVGDPPAENVDSGPAPEPFAPGGEPDDQ